MFPPPRDPPCPFVRKYLSPIHIIYQSGILGQGGQQSKNAEKFFQFMKKKILDYFQNINCINVSIHRCNCCKTGIEVSEYVYLASMTGKIKRTVAGHNHDSLQQCIFDVLGPQPE